MKQNITLTDLNQLSEKGKKKLRKWWKPKIGDVYVDTVFFGVKPTLVIYKVSLLEQSNLSYPLLSIGQMIEFLDENQDITGNRGDEWGYLVMPCRSDEVNKLCDSLWDACKEVLEDD